jgi:hypothetical protein
MRGHLPHGVGVRRERHRGHWSAQAKRGCAGSSVCAWRVCAHGDDERGGAVLHHGSSTDPRLRVARSGAFGITRHAFYLESGVEELNHIEYNLAAFGHVFAFAFAFAVAVAVAIVVAVAVRLRCVCGCVVFVCWACSSGSLAPVLSRTRELSHTRACAPRRSRRV